MAFATRFKPGAPVCPVKSSGVDGVAGSTSCKETFVAEPVFPIRPLLVRLLPTKIVLIAVSEVEAVHPEISIVKLVVPAVVPAVAKDEAGTVGNKTRGEDALPLTFTVQV